MSSRYTIPAGPTVEDILRNNPSYSGGKAPGLYSVNVPGLGGGLVPAYYDEKQVQDTKDWLARQDQIKANALLAAKQAQLYGMPQQTTTKTTPRTTTTTTTPGTSTSTTTSKKTLTGTKPTMGELKKMTIPERPDIPEFVAPEMGEIPKFEAPAWNEKEVSRLTQKRAAPGLRNLREAVQMATARNYDNPNVKRMSLKAALSGYGAGLEGVMSAAAQQAMSEYSLRHAEDFKAAGMNYNTAVQAMRDKYQGNLRGRELEYQADVNALNQVYAADIAAEQAYTTTQNQAVMDAYNNAWNAYLSTGETTTTSETTSAPSTTTSRTEGGDTTSTNKYVPSNQLSNQGTSTVGWYKGYKGGLYYGQRRSPYDIPT